MKKSVFFNAFTFSLVLSRKPRPHTVHLNFSRASAKWNFLCFINAFLLADTFPQIEHVSGPCMWRTRICSRIEFLLRDLFNKSNLIIHIQFDGNVSIVILYVYLALKHYQSLQMSHWSLGCTSCFKRWWDLCVFILLLTLPHKSQTMRWSLSW